MTNEQAIKWLKAYIQDTPFQMEQYERAFEMAIKALSQEPCELLIIKSDILLHQDDRKKWMESIKREKESGVIILPPYFEPLLVPNDIEISIEQEPCEDAISREAAEQMFRNIRSHLKPQDYKSAEEFNTRDLMLLNAEQMIHALPSVTQKSGKWIDIMVGDMPAQVCDQCNTFFPLAYTGGGHHYCPNCGAKMESEE